VLVGPLVPDGDAVLLQPPDIRVAADEPQELADDGADVHLLRGHEREAVREVEPQLRAEDAASPGAGPIALLDAVLEHLPKKIEVLPHEIDGTTGSGSSSLARAARRGSSVPHDQVPFT
jgi:hypothetical protein